MPIYEYQCKKCGAVIEQFGIAEEYIDDPCEGCGSKARKPRIISLPAKPGESTRAWRGKGKRKGAMTEESIKRRLAKTPKQYTYEKGPKCPD